MDLRPWFGWLENSALGAGVRSSTYAFALIECFHLIGMVCLLGTMLVVNLRLLGLVFEHYPARKLASALAPVTWSGLTTMIVTGVLLLSSEALKCYDNPAFAWKMALLALGILSLFTTQRAGLRSGGIAGGFAGAVSLLLWFGVALAGRAIAFV